MSCNDSAIAESLRMIATALANSNASASATANADCNCLGESLSVTTTITLDDGTLWPILGSTPIQEIPPGSFPDGYEDFEEFDLDKCRKANQMVDDWIATLRRFGNTNWVIGVIGATLITACIVGIITVPVTAIPILLFALTGNIGITTLLLSLADEIESDRADWVCLMYTGENVEAITGAVSTLLTTTISLIGGTGAVAVALRTIALLMVNQDVLSYLFTSKAKNNYPDADCSCDTIQVMLGTKTAGVLTGVEGTTFTILSGTNVDIDSVTRYYCQFRCQEGECKEFTVETSGWSDPCPNAASLDTFESLDFPGNNVLDNLECTNPEVTDYPGQYLNFRSATEFSITVTVGPDATCP